MSLLETERGVSASELRGASVGEACQLVGGLVTGIMETYPDFSVVNQYRQIAMALPERVDKALQHKLLKKAQKENDSQASLTLLMLNLRSVFTVAEPYYNNDPEHDDELVCSGLQELLARLPNIKVDEQLKPQVHAAAREGIVAFLEQNEGVNPGLSRSGVIRDVQQTADQLARRYPWGTSKDKLAKVSQNLVNGEAYPKNAPGPRTVLDYLLKRTEEDSVMPEESDDVERELMEIFRHEEVIRQMALLPEREQQALRLWVWESMTFEKIGDQLGFTREEVRGILQRALRTLRHPTRSQSYR